MSVEAIILFGSRARKDAKSTSDTDLLLITTEERPRHSAYGNISLSLYSFPDLVSMARRGDLFLLHIVREGLALYDPNKRLEQLREAFNVRSSYVAETRLAADVGWYLVRFDREIDPRSLVSRRIAWCVRTILIARSVEQGAPIFAPQDLSRKHPLARRLIANRVANVPLPGSIPELREFLLSQSLPDLMPLQADQAAFRVRFRETGNAVGLNLLSRHGGEALEYE